MNVPYSVIRPPKGKLVAWCRKGWGSCDVGYWYAIDDKGQIRTSGDLYYVARIVNQHNLKGE